MSAFTQHNGPFGPMGPAPADWRELIAYYKDMLTKIDDKQDVLTFAASVDDVVASSDKAVNAGLLYAYVISKLEGYLKSSDFDTTLANASNYKKVTPTTLDDSSGQSKPATVSSINNALAKKADKFTTVAAIDTSSNIPTSNAVYNALANKADKFATTGTLNDSSNIPTSKAVYDVISKHTASHDSDADGNLVVDKVLKTNSISTTFGQNILTYGDVQLDASADTDNPKTKPAIEAGTDDIPWLFVQRPMARVSNGNGATKYSYLITQDEVGTVPVGGIIRWSKNWQDLGSITDPTAVLGSLGLPTSGEWLPCCGASIPSDVAYDALREICGSYLPIESYSIIHAKAAAEVTDTIHDIYAMNVTMLSRELTHKLEEAQLVIDKYNALIAGQNILINEKANISYVDNKAEHAENLVDAEKKRATAAESNITSRVDTFNHRIDKKATWAALHDEAKLRQAADTNLETQLVAEHIGAHEALGALRKTVDTHTVSIDQLTAEDARIKKQATYDKQELTKLARQYDTESRARDNTLASAIGDVASDLGTTSRKLAEETEERKREDGLLDNRVTKLEGN